MITFTAICSLFPLFPDVREHIRYIEKAVATKEPRYMFRVIRGLVSIRRKLNQNVLHKLLHGYMNVQAAQRDVLTAFLEQVKLRNAAIMIMKLL